MTSQRQSGPSSGPISSSEHLESARAWAAAQGFPSTTVEPLPGDVSARRYVRLHATQGSAILALYPDSLRSTCERFATTSRILTAAGVLVPRLMAIDCQQGRMLLEDVGQTTLYDERERDWSALEPFLESAVEIAGRIAAIPPRSIAGLNPPLGESLLRAELAHTWEVALGAPDLARAGFRRPLVEAVDQMIALLARAPRAVAHRDFMARNLVPLASTSATPIDRLAVLDHQDLRLAPAAYDLASLFNDSLDPPSALEERFVSHLLAADRKLDYHRAAAQRCLKIVGTFVAFEQRGDARHRRLIAPSLARARRHLAALPEIEPHMEAAERLLGVLEAAPPP